MGAWAETNGGEDGLRQALAGGIFGNDMRTLAHINYWLKSVEDARAAVKQAAFEKLQAESLNAAVRSAAASERSARSTEFAAWAAAAGAAATLVAAVIPLYIVHPEQRPQLSEVSPKSDSSIPETPQHSKPVAKFPPLPPQSR